MRTMSRHRRGFTLLEMLIALTIVGVIGAVATKLLASQSRFFDSQTNRRVARQVARSSTNVLLSDLRMVQDSGGVDSVSSDGKTIRVVVPYRFGIYCGTNGGNSYTFSMLPVDSAVSAMAVYGGYAFRDSATGRYTSVTPPAPQSTNAVTTSSTPSLCTGGSYPIRTLTINGRTSRIIDVTPKNPAGVDPKVGTAVYLWQLVTYTFAPSSTYVGSVGLWRYARSNNTDIKSELLAPFDTSARFRFYVTGQDTSYLTPPAKYLIRGVDVVLSAKSPRASAGSTNRTSNMITSIFFKNVRAF